MELGNDLGSTDPILLTFAPKEVNIIVTVPVKCDKRAEEDEMFDISLTLTSSNPQVRTGRNSAIGIIRDTTGNGGYSEHRRWYDRINYTVVVNFKQSSYEVMEDRGEVTVMITLSQPSFKQFKMMIGLGDVTAECK